jgi:hypothetical protein
MNRRGFLSNLPALAAVAVAAPVTIVASKPEMALAWVHPYCPKCGSAAMFMRRSNFVGDLVPTKCSGCEWEGVSPVAK